MSEYIDGYVLPVPKDKVEQYREMAAKAAAIWKEHGALEVRECVGQDLEVDDQIPFPKLAGITSDETVVFSWIVFRSREERDIVNAKVMADPRLSDFCTMENPPFEYTRMAYGGFITIVHV